VVVATLHNRGNAADGAQETVVADGPEDEVRSVYADTVATADDKQYEYVRLRHEGRDVDWWPPATGWTS
jgi:hypothetical protein